MLVDADSIVAVNWHAMTTVLETGFGMRLRHLDAKQARHSVAMHQDFKQHMRSLHSRQWTKDLPEHRCERMLCKGF